MKYRLKKDNAVIMTGENQESIIEFLLKLLERFEEKIKVEMVFEK